MKIAPDHRTLAGQDHRRARRRVSRRFHRSELTDECCEVSASIDHRRAPISLTPSPQGGAAPCCVVHCAPRSRRLHLGSQVHSALGPTPFPRPRRRSRPPRYSFSGHQTFPFRYAWLHKGVRAVDEDPEVFMRPNALVGLGVGKNMVASIRFWCEALDLIDMRGRSGVLTPPWPPPLRVGFNSPCSGDCFGRRTTGRRSLPGRPGHPLAAALATRFSTHSGFHVVPVLHLLEGERLHARQPCAMVAALRA